MQCDSIYPEVDGIPVLFPNQDYSPDLHQKVWDGREKAELYAQKYNAYMEKKGTPWGLYTHRSELNAIRKLTRDIDFTGKVVVDCGCANARLLTEYAEADILIGIDSSIILLQEAKQRDPDLWLICGQIENLPLRDCVADFTVSIRVFQHLIAPEHAFSEMVRITKPWGHVSLELYNKFNLKELYKRFRMSKSMSRVWPWSLTYDRYYSFREIADWCVQNHVTPEKYVGVGWGVQFYLLEPLKFRRLAPFFVQRAVYAVYSALDTVFGERRYVSKTMEKIAFIGSVQGERRRGRVARVVDRWRERGERDRADAFQNLLDNRNFSYVGDDRHHLRQTINWVARAQDSTADGGVSRGYSMVRSGKYGRGGWQPSYPETTGYLVPTMVKAAKVLPDVDAARRARRMADWLLAIQRPDGASQGGNITVPSRPAYFDTGQVLRGFHAIAFATDEARYGEAARKAVGYMLDHPAVAQLPTWEDNGQDVQFDQRPWVIYATAAAVNFSSTTTEDNDQVFDLGRRAGNAVLATQNDRGWFANCSLDDDVGSALLHTVAYTIDGLLDMGKALGENEFNTAAIAALDGVLNQLGERGYLPGRFDERWQPTVDWACLTGIAQIGIVAAKVHRQTGDVRYLQAAGKMREYLKARQNNLSDDFSGRGALWGSWPVSGGFAPYQAINWAAKYFADLLMIAGDLDPVPHSRKECE